MTPPAWPGLEPIFSHINEITQALEQVPSLAPGAIVNGLFNRLVALTAENASECVGDKLLDDLHDSGLLARVRGLCSRGESELEAHWAQRLAQAADVETALGSFPYMVEYEALAAQEVKMLRQELPQVQKVLFVGSGPLPLSALLMARAGLQVEMADYDAAAHACAQSWLRRCEGAERLRCLHGDVAEMTDFGRYDAVVLAALVGQNDADKRQFLAHLAAHMRPGQVLLARSATKLRRVLYCEVAPEMFTEFEVRQVWHPDGECVNSVVCARR